MKIKNLLLPVAALLLSATAFANQEKQEEIKVNGSCGSCKKHIEKAAHLPGVEKADWNMDTHVLTLVYDPGKVTTEKVEKSIASAGYDTEKYKASEEAYNKLDACCQYEREK